MSKTTLNPFENAKRTAQGGAGGASEAVNVSFDPSLTELVSTDVQHAIEEVADEVHIIDMLTAKSKLVSIKANSAVTITKNNNNVGFRLLLILSGNLPEVCGMGFVSSINSGANVAYTPVKSSSSFDFDMDTNVITISHSSNTPVEMLIVFFNDVENYEISE